VVAYSSNKFEAFFGLYIVTVIIYECYVFSIEQKAKHYQELFYRDKWFGGFTFEIIFRIV